MDNEEKILLKETKELEKQLEVKNKKLHEIWEEREKKIEIRIRQAEKGKGDFSLDELLFAAQNKCMCGAGMAYPEGIGVWGAWYCSNILLGRAMTKDHTAPLPFSFYEIKSENQPSAGGLTTRPKAKEGTNS